MRRAAHLLLRALDNQRTAIVVLFWRSTQLAVGISH